MTTPDSPPSYILPAFHDILTWYIEALFPSQRLPDLKPGELQELLGLHQDGKAHIEYEPDPALNIIFNGAFSTHTLYGWG